MLYLHEQFFSFKTKIDENCPLQVKEVTQSMIIYYVHGMYIIYMYAIRACNTYVYVFFVLKRFQQKKGSPPGIEPGTFCTQSRNHTARPRRLYVVQEASYLVYYILQFFTCLSWTTLCSAILFWMHETRFYLFLI